MRAFEVSPRASGLFTACAILAFTLPGCSAAPTAPASGSAATGALRAGLAGTHEPAVGTAAAHLFYPLQVGNHWGYDHVLALYVVPEGGPPGPAFGLSDSRERDLVCVEPRAGRDYVVEQESFGASPPWWVRYRQDDAGLYEFDGDIAVPPVCSGPSGRRVFDAEAVVARKDEAAWAGFAAKLADPTQQVAYRAAWERIQARVSALRQALEPGPGAPRAAAGGGVESSEITRLAYPLHPGTHWVIRGDPLFGSTVEGEETLDLAVGHVPGWRIRIESDLFGTHDSVHLWYGRSGYLKLAAHLEGIATDQQGNPIGVLVADESEVLTELSLGSGRFAAH